MARVLAPDTLAHRNRRPHPRRHQRRSTSAAGQCRGLTRLPLPCSPDSGSDGQEQRPAPSWFESVSGHVSGVHNRDLRLAARVSTLQRTRTSLVSDPAPSSGTPQSAQSRRGRGWARRSTATSRRSTRSSTSLAEDVRHDSRTDPSTCRKRQIEQPQRHARIMSDRQSPLVSDPGPTSRTAQGCSCFAVSGAVAGPWGVVTRR
jgi:hypothetical protein